MGEVLLTLVIVILMLFVVCFIGSLILAKNTKELHINFSWKGFDISGSFFDNDDTQEQNQSIVKQRVVVVVLEIAWYNFHNYDIISCTLTDHLFDSVIKERSGDFYVVSY